MAKKKKAAPSVGAGDPPGFELEQRIRLDSVGRHVVWSPRSNLIAVTSTPNLRLLRTADWKWIGQRPATSRAAAFSPDGERIALSERGTLSVAYTAKSGVIWRAKIENGLGRPAWAPDGGRVAVGTGGLGTRVYAAQTGKEIATLDHTTVSTAAWSPDGTLLATAGYDGILRIWNGSTWAEEHRLEVHRAGTLSDMAWSPDGKVIATSLWSVPVIQIVRIEDMQVTATLEGHTTPTEHVAFSRDGRLLISSSESQHLLWSTESWAARGTFPSQSAGVCVAFDPGADRLAMLDEGRRNLLIWRYNLQTITINPTNAGRYVNAKVVVVGDTGVGKSGLALVLSNQGWSETGSTHGRHVWVLDNETVKTPDGQVETRETLLWDLAGQPDYRLVHQLHLDDVTTALVVFDSRSQTDPLAGVKYWSRALRQATQAQGPSGMPMKKFLVAARSDVGRVGLSAERVARIVDELGFDGYFETSAREGWGIDQLKAVIADSIDWSSLPMVSSNAVFNEIKQFLFAEKAEGRLLSTVDDLYDSYIGRKKDVDLREEFDACIGLLESRGLIQRLGFGDLVLLQPEMRDTYASALVSAAKDEPDGLGSIREDDARGGNFRIPTGSRLANTDMEKLLLISTVEDLLKHEIAFREEADDGSYLVFPSQLTRENPALPDVEGKAAVFAFNGPVMNIYATLTVLLSDSGSFRRKELWKNAATYSSPRGGTYGVFLTEVGDGAGELTLFYEDAAEDLKLQFEQYVEAHLLRRAIPETIRLRRIHACPACGVAITETAIQKRRQAGLTWINCNVCEPPRRISIMPAEEPLVAKRSKNRAADTQHDRETATSSIHDKRQRRDFDVFLCHNRSDKPAIKDIGQRLLERGILPWLDEWEVPPFAPWQDELERTMENIKSVAVFVGPSAMGPWQELEIKAFLQEFTRRRIRIGLVLLPGATQDVKLPMFLKPFHWVDFNKSDPDPLAQLIWGITGERPSAYAG